MESWTTELQTMQLLQCVAVVLLLLGAANGQGNGLSNDYYKESCPQLESIVKKALRPVFLADIRSPPAFLRIFFHDCQVQGCDASLLLDTDGARGITSELDSGKNFKIRNLDTIAMVKSKLEQACPNTVSCADIMVLAAREAVAYSSGPYIFLPLGRKDGTTASSQGADADLPPATTEVDKMLQIFTSKGMSIEESVAILGAHTLGVGHCLNIVERLYGKQKEQEEMSFVYRSLLRMACPTEVPMTNDTFVFMDMTATVFDNQYYRDVIGGRGLFTADAAIARDRRTARYVRAFARDQDHFFDVFSKAFVKLSTAGVLTERDGQIRKQCNRVN